MSAAWRAAAFLRWADALRLPDHPTLLDTFVAEAAQYFGLPPQEVRWRMQHGTGLLAEEWERMNIDPTSEADLRRFYNENTAEPFELLEFNAHGEAAYNYVAACEAACSRAGRSYLDYGSGVGSGAIFFARQGFDVTLADLSTSLLRFAEWRLTRRALPATYLDLTQEALPANRFDVITAFDVLEHIPDPLAVITRLRDALVPGGLLCFNAPFGHDDERPMHIFHDEGILRRLRAAGFARRWGTPAAIHVLQKVSNPPYRRWFYTLYDDRLESLTRRLPVGAIRRRLTRSGTP